jgi:hypothetical protein
VEPRSLPCSNSADSLFSANDYAVRVNALACSGRQGICPQPVEVPPRIDLAEPPEIHFTPLLSLDFDFGVRIQGLIGCRRSPDMIRMLEAPH